MNAVISVIVSLLPLLRDYFTKNKGLNSTTAGALGAFGVLLVQALEKNQGGVDQVISYVSNQGAYGVYVAAAIVGLRTAIYFLKAK